MTLKGRKKVALLFATKPDVSHEVIYKLSSLWLVVLLVGDTF